MGRLKQLYVIYERLNVYSIIVMVFQLLKNLDFHPRMGLVSRTIRIAAFDLFFFFILMGLITGLYAILGTLIFGRESNNFATVSHSTVTMLSALAGMACRSRQVKANARRSQTDEVRKSLVEAHRRRGIAEISLLPSDELLHDMAFELEEMKENVREVLHEVRLLRPEDLDDSNKEDAKPPPKAPMALVQLNSSVLVGAVSPQRAPRAATARG